MRHGLQSHQSIPSSLNKPSSFTLPALFYMCCFLSLSLTHYDYMFINVKFFRAEIIALSLHEVWDADSFDKC